MKCAVVLVFCGCLVAALSPALAQGGFGLCVKPGMLVNAVHFGAHTGSMFAGFGLEFASVSTEQKSTYQSPDTTTNSTTKTAVNLFLPQLGAKIFLGGGDEGSDQTGHADPYVWLGGFYSLATASATYSDGDTSYSDTAWAREVRDVLGGNFGGAIAVGGEYYFSPHFSVGGEFGVRMLFAGTKDEHDYGEGYKSIAQQNLGLGVTYTTAGLNFYF